MIQTRSRIGVALVLAVASGCSDGSSTDRNDDNSSVSTSAPSESSVPLLVPLFDFGAAGSANGWSVVNDTVMGGVSSGRLVENDGALIFSGELSLDNNGGFASVRSPAIEPQSAEMWSNRAGPQIVFVGDGRTWTVEVRTDDAEGGWIASLPTVLDSMMSVTLPWTSFEAVTRFLDPRETDGPLDPRRIVSIAFYLVDGVEAPFRLGLVSIS